MTFTGLVLLFMGLVIFIETRVECLKKIGQARTESKHKCVVVELLKVNVYVEKVVVFTQKHIELRPFGYHAGIAGRKARKALENK